jgi:glucose-1-phosphate adenylyltransferase
LPVRVEEAGGFGIIAADTDGRVRGFQEKPANPATMPERPSHAFASMGNYIFDADVLVRAVLEAKQRGESDFGHHVLPRMVSTHKVYAYDFSTNRVPGLRDYEDQSYWRDVGTIDTYFAANQDVLGAEPRFNLFNPRWMVRSSGYQGPPAKILDGSVRNSMLGAGTLVKGASVRSSILRREIVLEQDVELDECIIMDYVIVRRGSKLKRVIVDRYNTIEPNSRIGFDTEVDRRRYHVTDSGIVVLAKGAYSPEFSRYQ